MNPIYKPKGRAREYGDYAINIYESCNHGCTYCYARNMAKRFGAPWTGEVKLRPGVVEATVKQLEREKITGKLIHLCFMCDPYPAYIDTTPTREIIKAIKNSGNYVQILTKAGMRAIRDFDLLDDNDWYGITLSDWNEGCIKREPNAANHDQRVASLLRASRKGIKTWVSFEPVYNPEMVYGHIRNSTVIDHYKIGMLNHYPSNINWGEFGRECERLCKKLDRSYYIKEDLRKAMEK